MNGDIERVLVSEAEINFIVSELALKIDKDYAYVTNSKDSTKLLLLGILKGSVVFMGELMKRITVPVEIDFMKVSSYGRSSVSSKNINILLDLYRADLENTDILIIEDIVDSGRTLSYLVDYLKLKGAKSVRTCTLLDKPDRREVDYNPDYTGKIIPDVFVVGYGLDYAEKYRALPYVGVLKSEVYS